MIAQVLNRDFLMQAAAIVEDELDKEVRRRKSPRRRRGMSTEIDELDTREIEDAVQALRSVTVSREDLTAEAGDPTDDHITRPKSDFAYVPRDALLSLIQTAIDEHVEQTDGIEIDVTPMLDDRRSGNIPIVTDRRIADLPLTRTSQGRRKFGDMEVAKHKLFSDPGWLTSAFAMGVRFFRGRAGWVDDPPIVPIADNARVIVVGDWGSGIPRAKKVADQIRVVLDEDPQRQCHVVHLGDVYYSGSKREYERNFLNLWPVRQGEDVGSYSLCGNHDMYYGGHAYYDTCLADRRLERQNGCSFFALKNAHWQILGLDTGYEDGGLHGEQATWARTLIQSAPDHRTALLSHHQLFSAHESGAKVLQRKIEPVLATERIDAWLWGHEHRCIQYESTTWNGHRLGFSSCVGHGGIPEYLVMKDGETKPKPWVYEYTKRYGTAAEPWETFGFAVLDLNGKQMRARYIDEDGNQHHEVPKVVSS